MDVLPGDFTSVKGKGGSNPFLGIKEMTAAAGGGRAFIFNDYHQGGRMLS